MPGRRGVVGISLDGETLAVCLSLGQVVSLLFQIPAPTRRKKHKVRKKVRRKRQI